MAGAAYEEQPGGDTGQAAAGWPVDPEPDLTALLADPRGDWLAVGARELLALASRLVAESDRLAASGHSAAALAAAVAATNAYQALLERTEPTPELPAPMLDARHLEALGRQLHLIMAAGRLDEMNRLAEALSAAERRMNERLRHLAGAGQQAVADATTRYDLTVEWTHLATAIAEAARDLPGRADGLERRLAALAGPSPERRVGGVSDISVRWAELAAASPAGLELVELCGFLAPDVVIPLRWLLAGGDLLPSRLRLATDDGMRLAEAVGLPVRLGLLTQDGGEVRVAAEVPELLARRLGDAAASHRRHQAAALVLAAFPVLEVGTAVPVREAARATDLLPHLEWLADTVGDTLPGLSAALCERLALFQYGRGDLAAAENTVARMLAVQERALPSENSPDAFLRKLHALGLLDALDLLARIRERRGDRAGQRAALDRALTLQEEAFGPDSDALVTPLRQRAEALVRAGDGTGARAALERAWRIVEAQPDGAIQGRLEVLDRLAGLLSDLDDRPAAIAVRRRALAMCEHAFGPDDPELLAQLAPLAGLLREQGDLAAAQEVLERALAVEEAHFQPDHPQEWIACGLLAVLAERGDRAATVAAVPRLLRLYAPHLGIRHPDLAAILDRLVGLLRDAGELAAAEQLLARTVAAAAEESAYGPAHRRVHTWLGQLAEVQRQRGDLAAVTASRERLLASLVKRHGERHEAVALALLDLGEARAAAGGLEAALPEFQRALAIMSDRYGQTSPELARFATDIALVVYRAADLPRARTLLETAVALHEAAGSAAEERARALAAAAAVADGLHDQEAAAALRQKLAECGQPPIGLVALPALPGTRQADSRALARLAAAFRTSRIVILAGDPQCDGGGLDGSGTSELALAYASSATAAVRWWVAAGTRLTTGYALTRLAERLWPDWQGPADLTGVAEAVLAELGRRDDWLLVLDRVTDAGLLEPLARIPTGRVLVTTADPAFHSWGVVVELDAPPEAAAEDAARGIATVTGPSGARADSEPRAWTPALPRGRLAPAVREIQSSLEHLAGAGPAALELLQVCAFLDTGTDLPLDHLTAAPDLLPGALREAAISDPTLAAPVGQLSELGLLAQAGPDGRIPPLVAAVVRRRLAPEAVGWHERAALLMLARFPGPGGADPAGVGHSAVDLRRAARLAPHLAALADHPAGRDPALAISLREQLGEYLSRVGEPVATAHNLEQLAALQETVGDPAAAEAALGRALTLYERHGPGEEADRVRHALVDLLVRMGDMRAVKAAYDELITGREETGGPAGDTVMVLIKELVMVARSAGDLGLARTAQQRVVEAVELTHGPQAPELATALGELAEIQWLAGDRAAARHAAEIAVGIGERQGAHHAALGRDLTMLGTILHHLGELTAARAALTRALEVRQATLGPAHLEVARALFRLGMVHGDLSDYPAARAALERALAAFEELLGTDHTETRQVLDQLAGVVRGVGDLAAARDLYENSLANHEGALGPEHPEVGRTLRRLSEVLREMGDLPAAQAAVDRADLIDLRHDAWQPWSS